VSHEVKETGDRMVFEVSSNTTPGKTYRVDLTANNGAAECACKDWRTRRLKAIKAGALTLTRETTCRHVRAACTYFLRDVLKAMAKSESQR
jgi:hypothetical protein